jgi:succinate dehydrogenase / fumarate reductase, cytochrome b subunit
VFAGSLLYLLQESLSSPESHAHFVALTGHWPVRLFLIGMLWSFLHHFLAGLRFLLLDVHVAGDLKSTRIMSFVVLATSLALTAVLGALLW